MSTSRKTPINLFVGVGLGALGLACFAIAAYLSKSAPAIEAPNLEAQLSRCQRFFASLSLENARVGSELIVQRRSLDNPERLLSDASIGVLACELPLVRFCMGPGCRPPSAADGMTFVLSVSATSVVAGSDARQRASD